MSQVYLMYAPSLNLYKIGVSRNSKRRVLQLQTGCPYEIQIAKIYKSKHPFKVEKYMHTKYASQKTDINEDSISGEWFNLTVDQVISFDDDCKIGENLIQFLKDSGNPFV